MTDKEIELIIGLARESERCKIKLEQLEAENAMLQAEIQKLREEKGIKE